MNTVQQEETYLTVSCRGDDDDLLSKDTRRIYQITKTIGSRGKIIIAIVVIT